jgi:malate dehydrogenase (oxaloacetate-decarboxylating)
VYDVNSGEAMDYRRKYRGVIGIESKVPMRDQSVLSLVYTPGVAEPCRVITRDPAASFDVTCRGNTVAIVTNGSSIFGLGNVGPEAALPVMEGKSVIFKTFAGVDALPICLDTQDPFEIIETVIALGPTFGAICVEDIESPMSLTVSDHLRKGMNIPVWNNHHEGVAVGVLAGLLNALKIVDKEPADLSVVVNGAGAAGIGTAKILREVGVEQVIVCDRQGAIYKYRPHGMNWAKWDVAKVTNPGGKQGDLATVLQGADVFIGFAADATVTPEMVQSMAADPIVFAFGAPEPEIRPELAREAGAKVVATARADYPNQMELASVFPGVFRGLLDVHAEGTNDAILLAAARTIAGFVSEAELHPDYIVPHVLDFRVAPAVATAVARAAIETGVAKRPDRDPDEIGERTRRYVYEGRLPVKPKHFGDSGSGTSLTGDLDREALELHDRYQGVLEINNKIPIRDQYVLSMFYLPPGAVEPARVIAADPSKVYDITTKSNLVAVVSDGSAVLGLGNIGGRAALPVMEGKAVLFHTFAGVEAFPICLSTQDADEIVDIVAKLAPTFGGVNLEDISAPRCFDVERRLKESLDIPVFHDDQHGTAVVVLAGLLNACKLTGKDLGSLRIVINGAGAAGVAVAKLLLSVGVGDIILVDSTGVIHASRERNMNWIKAEMAQVTNRDGVVGDLADAVRGRDVFVGVSAPGALTSEMVASMADDPLIFALANPIPEIFPEEALAAGAAVVATGRSDLDNQVNNSLAFPGIFRGALDVRARSINDAMKIAAAHAIAGLVPEEQLRPNYIIPKGMDFRVAPEVAGAVARAAMDTGEARIEMDPVQIARNTRTFIYEGHLGELEARAPTSV